MKGYRKMNKCDICGSTNNIKPGRWIFYCPEHEQNDIDKTLDNEITPDLQSGNLDYLTGDEELQEILLNNI